MARYALSALMLLLVGCTDAKNSIRTLEASGFTEIEVGGYAAWSCGREDIYATAFRATNAQGMRVSGAVCCGFLKACTVRF